MLKLSSSRLIIAPAFALCCGCLLITSPVNGQTAVATTAAARSAYAAGSAAQLNARQTQRLRRLRSPIAIPTYIPPGFRLREVTSDRDTKTVKNFAIINYTIEYATGRGRAFSIISANEGLGDLELVQETRAGILNPYFEYDLRVGYIDDGDGGAAQEIGSQWIGCLKRYARKESPDYGLPSYALRANGITLIEAMKIMKSLRYLAK